MADSDDNGVTDLQDMIYTIQYLFLAGDPIPAPYPERGLDPTPDELPCPTSGGESPSSLRE